MKQNEHNIAFIGGGNIAQALIAGLLDGGWRRDSLRVAEPLAARRESLASRFNIAVCAENSEAVAGAAVALLAVKPQQARAAIESVAAELQREKPLLLSVVAGLRCAEIARIAGADLAIVRAMPNTPAQVRAGMCGLFAAARVNAAGRETAEAILRAAGEAIWVQDEAQLDAVTAISGSGPAYFFLLMQLLAEAGERFGFDSATANQLAVQTAAGAAALATQSARSPAELRAMVTSPGGTTAAALQAMQECGFVDAVQQGVAAAHARAGELGGERF